MNWWDPERFHYRINQKRFLFIVFAFILLNHISFAQSRLIPNDPQFSTQWQYINVGNNGGTPDADLDADEAWDRVHTANMAKQVGKKDGRPNPLGLPDLIKPDVWVGPDHGGNHGLLSEI